MSDKISRERKTAYYAGTAIAAFGLLMFLSVFVTHALNFGNFQDFDGQVRSSMFRSIGGMVGDALDESGIPEKFSERGERVVMIRCTACGKLNEEDSKFCQECGVVI